MIIKYNNYTIQEDIWCYILTKYWIEKKWKNVGKESILKQIYPSTLEKCFLRIIENEKSNKKIVLEMTEYLKELKDINNNFIKDINLLTK